MHWWEGAEASVEWVSTFTLSFANVCSCELTVAELRINQGALWGKQGIIPEKQTPDCLRHRTSLGSLCFTTDSLPSPKSAPGDTTLTFRSPWVPLTCWLSVTGLFEGLVAKQHTGDHASLIHSLNYTTAAFPGLRNHKTQWTVIWGYTSCVNEENDELPQVI